MKILRHSHACSKCVSLSVALTISVADPNWGPKGRKNVFETAHPSHPTLSQGLDDWAPPFSAFSVFLKNQI